jgi:hypothetical protein
MPAMAAEAGPPTDGPEEQPARRLWVDLLQAAALLGAVAVAAALLAPHPHAGRARLDAAVTVVHGPASVRGRVALLAGGPDELRVTVDVRKAGSATTGSVMLRGATFVVWGRPQCMRIDGDTAIVGLTWTARDLLGADRPTKGAAILTFSTRGLRLRGTYDLGLGRRLPDCTVARPGGAAPATGRLLISRP